MYTIYKHTNVTSGKSYVGLTGRTVPIRWKEHLYSALVAGLDRHFYRAIRLYGKDDWASEVLESEIEDLSAAQAFEKAYVLKYDTFENGYNSTLGGEGVNGLDPFCNFTDEEKMEHSRNATASLYKRYNTEEVSLYNEDFGVVVGFPGEIIKQYGMHTEVYNVINGKRKHIQGWFLWVGKGGNYNKLPVYSFIHGEYGVETMTLKDMAKKYNLSKGNLSMVTSGSRKHIKGWSLNLD